MNAISAPISSWAAEAIVPILTERIRPFGSRKKQEEEMKRCGREDNIALWAVPKTGVTVFRPLVKNAEAFYKALPEGMFSTCVLENETWIRSVAANPLADLGKIINAILSLI